MPHTLFAAQIQQYKLNTAILYPLLMRLKLHRRQRKMTDEAVNQLMGLVVEPLHRDNSDILLEKLVRVAGYCFSSSPLVAQLLPIL